MNNSEFSNTFDVLYNNITSNQAPGLDEYEKSVFLTKAQDEVVKAYFNPRLNKTQEGFDGSERRQIDFSMIMRSLKYESLKFTIGLVAGASTPDSISDIQTLATILKGQSNVLTESQYSKIDTNIISVIQGPNLVGGQTPYYIASPFLESFFDYRDNTRSVVMDSEILMFVNEYATVTRGDKTVRLTVVPINYTEYSRLMSKPYKRPLKYQAWRILDNSATNDNPTETPIKKVELVIGPNDSLTSYVVRYVKRPRAIRLITFDDVTLDGSNEEQSCELDPCLHEEILQRAVELAKAAYTGDLNSQIALGQSSQTTMGAVATQQSR
jgi:hypothetical protein